jgi:hypothetical protein
VNRVLALSFVAAVALYVPTVRYGFVQDDRAIIAQNPAAHSVGAALQAFDDPYWPRESGAGLYRPVTILSYAVDWSVSGGRAGWLHLINALWHGLATVLFVAVVARWLSPLAAAAAGLVFAWHPVHVEAIASLVGRAELLAAVGILGAVLAARRGLWIVSVLCAALAMLSKEHGVIAGVVILLDWWLQLPERGRYPKGFWIALGAVSAGFIALWFAVGWVGTSDVAAVFYGRSAWGRLAIALPAIWRAALLLIWPASLSADYNPQVLPWRSGGGLPFAAFMGLLVVVIVPVLVFWCRRRAPAISFAAGLAGLSYLPTANLLFPSGVVLAERNLYLAVGVAGVAVAAAIEWIQARPMHGWRPAIPAIAVVAVVLGWRSFDRLPAWRDNRTHLLTLLAEHPESYRAHASAAAVLAGTKDTAGARREYRIADSLFSRDPYTTAAHAIFLLGIHDTAAAAPLVERATASGFAARMALRARFLLAWERRRDSEARSLADSARSRYPQDRGWYLTYLQ